MTVSSGVPQANNTELRRHWPVVLAAACGAGAGITGMTTYSLSVMIGPLAEAFGWNRAQLGGAKTVLTAGFILTAPFVGMIADRFGTRRIAIASMCLLTLAMLAMTQVGPSVGSYYVALFALAIAGGATTPLVWTRAVATWFHRQRGLAMALTLSGTGAMGIVTPPLLNSLVERFGWRAAYVAMALVALLALIPIALRFEDKRGVNHGTAPDAAARIDGVSLAQAWRVRAFWQIGAGFFLIGGAVSAVMVHLVPILGSVGMTRGSAVAAASLLGLTVIVGRLITGWLVDRFHPPFVAALFLIVPVFGCWLLASGQLSTVWVIVAVITFGLAAGSEVDLVPFLTARYFGLRAYGRIYACMFIGFYAGVGMGPLLLGRFFDRDGNYSHGLEVLIPALILGAVLVATLGRSPLDRISGPSQR